MLGWQSYTVAPSTLTCIELMHMRKKRQMVAAEGIQDLTAAEQCYTLAV
jgi:hypothetical protein